MLSPRDNPTLLGQDEAEWQILQALASGRFAHGWILAGPRGVGKATLAYRLARYLLSDRAKGEGLALSPDDPIFRLVASGGHPDLMVLERQRDDKTEKLAKNIAVDDVRNLAGFLHLTPSRGAWRVVIIDSADDFNRNAANALLKVLEEPPPRTAIIMVAHQPDKLLPTLRSRCRMIRLRPLSPDQVMSVLRQQVPDLSSDDADLAARLAEGSPGRALSLCADEGLKTYRTLVGLLQDLPRLDLDAVLSLGDKINRGEDGQIAFRDLYLFLQQAIAHAIASHVQGTRGMDLPLSMIFSRLITAGNLSAWQDFWPKLQESYAAAEGINLDRKQNLLLTLQEIASIA